MELFSSLCEGSLGFLAAVSCIELSAGFADALLVFDRPISKRFYRHQQIASQIRQLVIHTWRNGRINCPGHKSVAFKTTQRTRQHLLRDTIDCPLQLVELHRPIAEILDDHHRPFVADACEEMVNRRTCRGYFEVIWFQKSASLRPFRTVTYIAPVTNSYHPPR